MRLRLSLLLLLIGAAGCPATDSNPAQCGLGTAANVEGASYCVYQREVVIEEGFTCPPEMILYDHIDEDLAVCGPTDSPSGAVAAARETQATSTWDVNEPSTATFHGEIGALLEAECGDCHQAGGPLLDFGDYNVVVANLSNIQEQVESGMMPAWNVTNDGSCSVFPHAAGLSATERSKLLHWIGSGAAEGAEGNAADWRPVPIATDVDAKLPDLTLVGESNRCFLLNTVENIDNVVAAKAFATTDIDYLTLHAVSAADLSAVEDRATQDPSLGFDCRSPEGLGPMVAGWTHGPRSMRYPDGFGATLAAGSRLLLRVGTRRDTTADAIGFELELGAATTSIRGLPVEVQDLILPAGQSDAAAVSELTGAEVFGGRVRIHGFLPSERSRLKSLDVQVIRPDGTESCAFQRRSEVFRDWTANLFPTLPVTIEPEDVLRIQCSFDTSSATEAVRSGLLPENEVCRVGLMVEDLP